MQIKEAYSILEIPQTTTPEEAKKKYRELTKQYHPDVNKDPGAEDKFKKINEAYSCVSSGKGSDREDNFQDYNYNPFGQQHPFNRRTVQVENINLNTTISFKDSVFGIKKELKFSRKGKCQNCNGQGEIQLNNGCDKCNGRGQVVSRQGNMIFTQTCDKCHGQTKTENCKSCPGTGRIDTDVSIHVSIPGGVVSGNILRLNGMGNYLGSFMGMDQFTEALLHISVEKEDDLKIDGKDVISTIQISLLEALMGCSKKVRTVSGEREIIINPMSRNREEVNIPKMGVNQAGNHRVSLDVKYPENTAKLISALTDEVVV